MESIHDRRKPRAVPLPPKPDFIPPTIPDKPWLNAREAAEALGVGRTAIQRFIKQGKLPFEQLSDGRRDLYFRRQDVVALARSESSVKRFLREAKRISFAGRLPLSSALHPETLITTQQAASILGVSVHMVRKYIYRNYIYAYQDKPGHSGSRCYLLNHAVMRLKENRELRKDRLGKNRQLGPQEEDLEAWQEARYNDKPDRGWSPIADTNYGDFFSTRQVTIVLGISRKSVLDLRSKGRLQGYQIRYKHNIDRRYFTPIPQAGPSFWFYKKEDVYNLMADPAYQKRRRHWKFAQSEEACSIRQQKVDEQFVRELDACMAANGFVKDAFGDWQKW